MNGVYLKRIYRSTFALIVILLASCATDRNLPSRLSADSSFSIGRTDSEPLSEPGFTEVSDESGIIWRFENNRDGYEVERGHDVDYVLDNYDLHSVNLGGFILSRNQYQNEFNSIETLPLITTIAITTTSQIPSEKHNITGALESLYGHASRKAKMRGYKILSRKDRDRLIPERKLKEINENKPSSAEVLGKAVDATLNLAISKMSFDSKSSVTIFRVEAVMIRTSGEQIWENYLSLKTNEFESIHDCVDLIGGAIGYVLPQQQEENPDHLVRRKSSDAQLLVFSSPICYNTLTIR